MKGNLLMFFTALKTSRHFLTGYIHILDAVARIAFCQVQMLLKLETVGAFKENIFKFV